MPSESNQDLPVEIFLQEYSLWDFLRVAQQRIQQGYEFDFETNAGAPDKFGTTYTARMTLVVVQEVFVPAEAPTEAPEGSKQPTVASEVPQATLVAPKSKKTKE